MSTTPNKVIYSMIGVSKYYDKKAVLKDIYLSYFYGASPRGAQTLIIGSKVLALLAGRSEVAYEDIRKVVLPALRHRVILNFEGEAERVDTDNILKAIIDWVPEKSGVK